MQITEEGFFVSGEREVCSRNRNTYVDTNHTAIGQKLKFSCIISVLGEDYGTICKRICVHQSKSFVKIFHSLNQRYRSEDLSVTYGHARFYVIKNGRSYEESILIRFVYFHISSIQYQRSTFVYTFLNPLTYFLLMCL